MASTYALLADIIMLIPFYFIRHTFFYFLLGHFGKNSALMRKVEIRKPKNVFIGDNTIINKKALLDGRGGKLIIGNNVDIAQEVNIWTLEHDVNDDFHKSIGADVIIEDYVWIASRATILPGVKIGRGAVIASIVTKDILPMQIAGGIPAKVIGMRKSKLLYQLCHKPWFD